jgi:hypothetical protein
MINIVKDLKDGWYLIELEGTNYYQIVNKLDVIELLLEHNANIPITNFPMSEEELADRLERTKQLKEFSKQINK